MINLYTGRTYEDFWDSVLLPWFNAQGRNAWRSSKPTCVVAPTVEALHHLKGLLFETGIPYFAVRFVLPEEIRKEMAVLLADSRLPDAKLLAAMVEAAANSVLAEKPDDTVAAAVSRGPHTLTETLDVLHQGGWGAEQVEGDSMREIARRVEAALQTAHLLTAAQLDHRMASLDVATYGIRFESVLAVGFDARHWKFWPLLKAAANFSSNFTACLTNPTALAEQADLVWTGSFEELGQGNIHPVLDSMETEDMGEMASAVEADRTVAATVPVQFLAATNQTSQARMTAEKVAAALADGATSIAVLAPGPGVTARETALAFERLGIAHYNGIPVRRARMSDPEAWTALVDTLETPTIANLLGFLRIRSDIPPALYPHSTDKLLHVLDRDGANFIFPEIKLLGGFLAEGADTRSVEVGQFLQKWPQLPESDTLGNFLTAINALLGQLEWGAARLSVQEVAGSLSKANALTISRSGFCSYIRDAVLAPSPIRTELGGNPFARVQILRPEDAVTRRWDKIFFTGQNDGVWPPRIQPGGYLSDEDLVALNSRIRALNEAVTDAGTGGDGTLSVIPGRSYMVGPFEYRALHVRDFIRLLESCNSAVIIAAIEDETAGGAAMHPGELYLRAHRAVHGGTLSREQMTRIAARAEGSLHPSFLVPPTTPTNTTQMMTAWTARRDKVSSGFSSYEFCLNETPTWELNIPASAWGRVFDRPAEIFLRHVLGVSPTGDLRTSMPWGMVSGNWTHDWLQSAAPTGATPAADQWISGTTQAAQAFRSRVCRLLRAEGRELPTWWASLWAQSLAAADSLAETMGAAARHPYVITEGKLPKTLIKLPSGRVIPSGGRFDLVFSDSLPNAQGGFTGTGWLVDFKTGSDKPLTPKDLFRLKGIQLSLYGLILEALGMTGVDISLQRPGESANVQVTTNDVRANIAVMEKLADMAQFGRFGYYGEIHSEFPGGSTYPIATLSASASVDNAQKFAATHGI